MSSFEFVFQGLEASNPSICRWCSSSTNYVNAAMSPEAIAQAMHLVDTRKAGADGTR